MVSLTHSSYAEHEDLCKPLVANCTGKYTNCTAVTLVPDSGLPPNRVADRADHYTQVQLRNSTRVNGTQSVLFRYEDMRVVPNANLFFR